MPSKKNLIRATGGKTVNEHEKFMREAIRLANENIGRKNGGPFGAVIVKEGEIIASGRNMVLSHNDPTSHAEIVAIREACRILGHYHLDGCTIYSSCEPCPMCLGAISWARPKALYFAASRFDAALAGFDDALFYEESGVPLENRMLPTRRLLEKEGRETFEKWNESGLNINY